MKSLPIELLEHVVSALVTYPTDEDSAIPSSSEAERRDLYNVRRTCRALWGASARVFVHVVQDKPFYSTIGSMKNLQWLLLNPAIGDKIKQLTIAGFPPASIEEQTNREIFLHKRLEYRLTKVLKRTPCLRRLRCIPVNLIVCESDDDSNDDYGIDPFSESLGLVQIAHRALHAAALSESMESFTIRTKFDCASIDQEYFHSIRLDESHKSIRSIFSFSYPHLQHLTLDLSVLDPAYSSLPFDPVCNWPRLKTMHLIQNRSPLQWDRAEDGPQILRDLCKFEAQEISLTNFWTCSWRQNDIHYLIEPLSYRKTPIQRLKLFQIEIEEASALNTWLNDLAKDFAIQELELVNIEISYPNENFKLDKCKTGWDALPWLCKYAKVVHVHNGSEETFIYERPKDVLTPRTPLPSGL